MINKLNEYFEHIHTEANTVKQVDISDKPLFENSYIDELHTRSIRLSGDVEREISKLSTIITDKLVFIQNRKQELEKATKDLNEAEDAKMQLLIQTPDLTEEMLDKNFKDFKGYNFKFESLSKEFLGNSGKVIKHKDDLIVKYKVEVSKEDFKKEYYFESKLEKLSFEINE